MMKKITVLFCLLSAAALAAVWKAPVLVSAAEERPALEEPPALTVHWGEQEVQAWRGGYSWEQVDASGRGKGVIACGPNPNDPTVRENLPRVAGKPGEVLVLAFPVEPDQCSAALRPDGAGEGAEAVSLSVDAEGRLLLPDDCRGVYEIWAEWDLDQGGGNASYAFCVSG